MREQIRRDQRISNRPITQASASSEQLQAILGDKIQIIEEQQPVITAKPQDAQTTIELAKLRTQIKKLQKQLSVRADASKQAQLDELEQRLAELQG